MSFKKLKFEEKVFRSSKGIFFLVFLDYGVTKAVFTLILGFFIYF